MTAPVVLVPGTKSSVDVDTSGLLHALGVSDVYVAGGTGAVSSGIEQSLRASFGSVERLAGPDRYTTSVVINSAFFDDAPVPETFLAVGTGIADALAGAALAGHRGAPLLVTPSTCVPTSAISAMAGWGTISRILLGGTAVLGVGVENKVPCADGGTFRGDGDYRVGTDVRPGTYDAPNTDGCYWERVSSFDGDFESIIENDYGTGQRIVSIVDSDHGFSNSWCGRWYPIDSAPALPSIPGSGIVTVGQQIEPGTYQATNPSGSCYWARLSDFEGGIGGVLANDFVTSGQPLVTINASDAGFESSGCGTWTRVS